jgi:kinesin family protein 1
MMRTPIKMKLGVYVKGLKEIVVDCPKKIQGIVDQGMKARTVASTQMNADSYRSHSVFTLKIHQKDSEDESRNLFAKVR